MRKGIEARRAFPYCSGNLDLDTWNRIVSVSGKGGEKMKKLLLVFVLSLLFLGLGTNKAQATMGKEWICHNGENVHEYRLFHGYWDLRGHWNWYKNHEDTFGKCPEPTQQPTPPSVVVLDPNDCHAEARCAGGTTAPVCQDGTTINLPANFHVIRNGTEATLKWWPTEADQVNVFYKEVGSPVWTHALADQPNNGNVVIGMLKPELGYVFGIMQKRGCGSGELVTAVVVDGAFNRLFPMSYWQWN